MSALLFATPIPIAVMRVWWPASQRTAVEYADAIRAYPCHDARAVYIASFKMNVSYAFSITLIF